MEARRTRRRRVLVAAGALAAAGFAARGSALASATTRILVGYAPGGSVDLLGRLYAERLRDALGASVVVENRAGAGGRIAAEALKHAAADGATLMLAPIVVPVFAPLVYRDLAFDPARDFAPVALVGHYQLGFAVGASHPAGTMTAFAAWARAHPAQASFGSPGTGGLAHFLGVMIARGIGVDLRHVAYKGAAPMLADLAGGQIPACIDTHVELIELHRGGRVRVLATTGATRSSRMPDVPTMREVGLPQVEGGGWFAFYVPAGTPAATVARLNASIDRISGQPEMRDRLAKLGIDVATLSPGALDRLAADERTRWAPVIRASGFKGD